LSKLHVIKDAWLGAWQGRGFNLGVWLTHLTWWSLKLSEKSWSLCIHPSEALIAAKESMQQDSDFCCWFHWAPYFCVGNDFPLFMTDSWLCSVLCCCYCL